MKLKRNRWGVRARLLDMLTAKGLFQHLTSNLYIIANLDNKRKQIMSLCIVSIEVLTLFSCYKYDCKYARCCRP